MSTMSLMSGVKIDRCIPMVEEMATETWLCVKSILYCTCIGQMWLIRIQGKIMYLETAEVP